MKRTNLLVLFIATIISASAQTLSPKVISAGGGYFSVSGGNSLSWTMGETNTATLSSTNNKLTQGFQQPEVELLNLTAFLQGFYTGGSTMRATLFNLGYGTDSTATDTIQVNLWSPSHLSNSYPDYSSRTILHKNGNATVACNGTVVGNSFYIAVKHRNSIETWSKTPFTFAGVASYNFSTALTQAYSNSFNPPMKSMGGGVYAFFSGDVTQDGTVDASDLAAVDNAAAHFQYGYYATDCNGNGATDASDMAVVDNDTQLAVFYARPF